MRRGPKASAKQQRLIFMVQAIVTVVAFGDSRLSIGLVEPRAFLQ